MAKVLTAATMITCSHEGGISMSGLGTPKLTVDGRRVLVEGSLDTVRIDGCTNGGGGQTPCKLVRRVLSSSAGKLRVGGKPALLDPFKALSDGSVPELSGEAEQGRLTAD